MMPVRAFALAECLPPIRLEIWSDVSLANAGAGLANASLIDLPAFHTFDLQARLKNNREAVRTTYLEILDETKGNLAVSPAAVWLLDNHHIVDETFRHLRRDLGAKAYSALPTVALTTGQDVPRVLAVGWTYLAMVNSEVALTTLTEIVEGMQSHLDLTIAEVWAIPALLRLILLENLRRLSDRTGQSHRLRAAANTLADRIAIAKPHEIEPFLTSAEAEIRDATFAAQLLYRMRDSSGPMDRAHRWLEKKLASTGETADIVTANEHTRQAAANVTMGNIVRSLRLIDDVDWLQWFETVAAVDRALRMADDYALLDKNTRNSYRETIERLARRSKLSEVEVVETALTLSSGADPGDVLVGDRLPEIEIAIGYRPSVAERLRKSWQRSGWLGLAVPAGVATLGIAAVLTLDAPWLFLLVILPASEAAMALIHLVIARSFPPERLPSYDFSKGIPETARTLVVIPCLLSSRDEIDALLRNIELHYLSNPTGAIDFALLSDWTDHPTEHRADDGPLLGHAEGGIEVLAARYSATGRRFYLLHRRRIWNAQEGVWMGWERKRGKLAELSALLRGDPDTSFMLVGQRPPAGVRFVMTLDSARQPGCGS